MTTESLPHTRFSGVRTLGGAALGAGLCGLLLVIAGGLTGGAAAAYGALVGTLLVVLVFGLGAAVVALVAEAMPAAALLVAVLTYTLQVVAMGLVFWRLTGSGLLDSRLDPTWLGVAIVVTVLAWLVVQTVRTTRARIPAFDLPATATTPMVTETRTAGEAR
ncbi:MAG: hypothetical protein R2731_14935 [Nocardioides sp.]